MKNEQSALISNPLQSSQHVHNNAAAVQLHSIIRFVGWLHILPSVAVSLPTLTACVACHAFCLSFAVQPGPVSEGGAGRGYLGQGEAAWTLPAGEDLLGLTAHTPGQHLQPPATPVQDGWLDRAAADTANTQPPARHTFSLSGHHSAAF